ncbi:MAG TPA: hypothetical protein VIF62_31080 [Labilithrix sp.]
MAARISLSCFAAVFAVCIAASACSSTGGGAAAPDDDAGSASDDPASDAGLMTPTSPLITCSEDPSNTMCSCVAQEPGSSAASDETSVTCEAENDSFCCMQEGYPAAAKQCGCAKKKKWVCEGDATYCNCGWVPADYVPDTPFASCRADSTKQVVCCAAKKADPDVGLIDDDCDCDDFTTACDADKVQVTSCATASSAHVAAPSTHCSDKPIYDSLTVDTDVCNAGGSTPGGGTDAGGTTSAAKGIGEKCSSNADCISNQCEVDGFCTRTCTTNEQCAGTPQINNSYGNLNYCAPNGYCWPSCTTSADCAVYGSGLTCGPTGKGYDLCG